MTAAASTASTTSTTSTTSSSVFTPTALVSNIPSNTAIQDANLQNGWGIAFGPSNDVWVNDHGSNVSTLYDGKGNVDPLVVSIPAAANSTASGPTGIIFNSTTSFNVATNGTAQPASFIFAGTGGTIAGWSAPAAGALPSTTATTMFDSTTGTNPPDVFYGLAQVTNTSGNFLLAADAAGNGSVDVFAQSPTNSSMLTTATLQGSFTDPNLPANYKPFNVAVINHQVYVTYTQFNGTKFLTGANLGLIDVYDENGNFLKRLTTGGALNAPWGMALAPASFGIFSNDLIVGNFGDGKMNVYDPTTGAFLGTISDSNGNPIVFQGLWGMAFGNNDQNQPSNTLFYASGPTQQTGVYGSVTLGAAQAATTAAPPAAAPVSITY